MRLKQTKNKFDNKQNGLTLLELSLAIIVIGLLTSAFIQLFEIQQRKEKDRQQNSKIFTIADALSTYLSENGHYPCPGRHNRGTTDNEFSQTTATTLVGIDLNSNGQDDLVCNDTTVTPDTCDATAGYCVALGTDGLTRIRIGAVPYKELNIDKEDVIDVYGNQFTYSVVENQASEGLYTTPGVSAINPFQIEIRDVSLSSCDPITNYCSTVTDVIVPGELTFFSHGKGGHGSFTSAGNPNPSTCASATGTGDQENCDNDHIFVTDRFANRSATTTGHSDDNLIHNLLSWTYIWDTAYDDNTSIYNRAAGSMAIGLDGNDLAQQKLHVSNGNLRVESGTDENTSGKIQTSLICDETNTHCFEPEVLSGTETSTKRLQCDKDGFLMAGVANGTADCRSILLDGSSLNPCTGLNYANGFTLDPTNGAISLNCASVP